MEKLFSYGTLQQDNVQIKTFGRLLEGEKDILIGYQIDEIKITAPEVLQASGKELHPILRYTGHKGDQVVGTVFEVTLEELAQADFYEVEAYERVEAQLLSGNSAWIYAARSIEGLD